MTTTTAAPDLGATTSDPGPDHPTRPSRALTVLASLLGLGVAAVIGTRTIAEVDLWWQLRTGQHVLQSHAVVWTDPWARLADRPYVATQWLPEVLAYVGYDHLGLTAIVVLRTLGVLGLLVATYAAVRTAGGRLVSVVVATLVLLGSNGSLAPRPQVISFICFALVVAGVWRIARDRRPRWWLVPLFWVWGCCHGLWAFGLLVLGVLVVALVLDPSVTLQRGQRRRLVLLLAACVGVLCLTPLGPRLLTSPLSVASVAAGVAEEWAPTPLYNVYALLTALLVLAVAVLWARRPARRPWWQVAMLVLAAGFTLWMWRLVPLGGILVAPLLAAELQTRMRAPREVFTRREASLATALGLVTAAAAVAALVLVGGGARTTVPGDTAAVDRALDTVPRGSVVYNEFGISGWMLWRHPDLSPVIDLRGEIYDKADFTAYNTVDAVRPGWEQALAASGATYALQDPDSPLATALVHRLGWVEVARSPDWVVLQSPAAETATPSPTL